MTRVTARYLCLRFVITLKNVGLVRSSSLCRVVLCGPVNCVMVVYRIETCSTH